MSQLIITAVIYGAEVTKAHNQAVRYSIAALVREAEGRL